MRKLLYTIRTYLVSIQEMLFSCQVVSYFCLMFSHKQIAIKIMLVILYQISSIHKQLAIKVNRWLINVSQINCKFENCLFFLGFWLGNRFIFNTHFERAFFNQLFPFFNFAYYCGCLFLYNFIQFLRFYKWNLNCLFILKEFLNLWICFNFSKILQSGQNLLFVTILGPNVSIWYF